MAVMPPRSMSPTEEQDLRSDLHNRSACVDARTVNLWIPGRRTQIAAERYDIGCSWRELGEKDLAVHSFEHAISVFDGRRPHRTKRSLRAFAIVASSHNHLGIIHLDQRNLANAVSHFDQAIQLRRELRQLFPDDRENQVYLGGALCNRGLAAREMNPAAAKGYFEQSLGELRQPTKPCDCSYWDEQRQSWWCEQLEALGPMTGAAWVALAPTFIDTAQSGLASLTTAGSSEIPDEGA